MEVQVVQTQHPVLVEVQEETVIVEVVVDMLEFFTAVYLFLMLL